MCTYRPRSLSLAQLWRAGRDPGHASGQTALWKTGKSPTSAQSWGQGWESQGDPTCQSIPTYFDQHPNFLIPTVIKKKF